MPKITMPPSAEDPKLPPPIGKLSRVYRACVSIKDNDPLVLNFTKDGYIAVVGGKEQGVPIFTQAIQTGPVHQGDQTTYDFTTDFRNKPHESMIVMLHGPTNGDWRHAILIHVRVKESCGSSETDPTGN